MNNELETIAAFVDGERVDPVALKLALSNEAGRDYLVELVAMREVVSVTTASGTCAVDAAPKTNWSWPTFAAVAALFVVVGTAGYGIGHFAAEQRLTAEREAAKAAPPATREVAPDTSTTWIETSGGL